MSFSFASVIFYRIAARYNSIIEMKQASKTFLFEMTIEVFSGGIFLHEQSEGLLNDW